MGLACFSGARSGGQKSLSFEVLCLACKCGQGVPRSCGKQIPDWSKLMDRSQMGGYSKPDTGRILIFDDLPSLQRRDNDGVPTRTCSIHVAKAYDKQRRYRHLLVRKSGDTMAHVLGSEQWKTESLPMASSLPCEPPITYLLPSAHYSLKSALVFSHPNGDCSIAATFSASCIFSPLGLSVHSSYMVVRLKSSVWDEYPASTSFSSNARPCLHVSIPPLSHNRSRMDLTSCILPQYSKQTAVLTLTISSSNPSSPPIPLHIPNATSYSPSAIAHKASTVFFPFSPSSSPLAQPLASSTSPICNQTNALATPSLPEQLPFLSPDRSNSPAPTRSSISTNAPATRTPISSSLSLHTSAALASPRLKAPATPSLHSRARS